MVLKPDEVSDYHSVFKNNHGRVLYLSLNIKEGMCTFKECYYLDRSSYSVPKKSVTKKCTYKELVSVIRDELDKSFTDIILEHGNPLSKEELIKGQLSTGKYNILIMIKDGDVLKTIFKNKFRRSIYIEIITGGEKSLISKCFYCDRRSNGKTVTPYGLKTIYFKSGIKNLLSIVNTELEGGFTDILISEESTVILDRPICGSI